jgi:nucleoside 2-deoxyribosyltransferase
VYLAGPEVFFAGGRALIARKEEIARRYGLEPVAPAEVGGASARPDDPYELGEWISASNEERIERADLTLANLTPFRGVSADPGTVFEVAYAIALGKPVYGYTNDPRDYRDRVRAWQAEGADVPGDMVEDHGMTDNLMIEGAIARRGGSILRATTPLTGDALWTDLDAFERCVAAALRT